MIHFINEKKILQEIQNNIDNIREGICNRTDEEAFTKDLKNIGEDFKKVVDYNN